MCALGLGSGGPKIDERAGYRAGGGGDEKITEAGPGSGQIMSGRAGFGRGGQTHE